MSRNLYCFSSNKVFDIYRKAVKKRGKALISGKQDTSAILPVIKKGNEGGQWKERELGSERFTSCFQYLVSKKDEDCIFFPHCDRWVSIWMNRSPEYPVELTWIWRLSWDKFHMDGKGKKRKRKKTVYERRPFLLLLASPKDGFIALNS